MVSSLTTLATPYLIRNSDRTVDFLFDITPTSWRRRLDQYHDWLEKSKSHTNGTPIFSKYLVRAGVYFAFLAAVVLTLNALSHLIKQNFGFTGPFTETTFFTGLWTFAAVACMPLFATISKYANHIILLLVTRSKTLLHYIDVHAFYNTLNNLALILLGLVFISAAAQFLPTHPPLIFMGFVLLFVTWGSRKRINRGKEWLERVLDQITGLATSEPTRQAVIKSGEGKLLLVDITDQVTLHANSPVVGKAIRDTRLREQTGASIVAIYRNGQHIANPGPGLILLPDDVLVLLGMEEELEKSRQLLNLPSE